MKDAFLWKKILGELELEVSPAVFNTMFKQTTLSELKDRVATIGCKSVLIQQLIETRYYALVKSVLDRHTKDDVSLVFTIASGLKKSNGNGGRKTDIGPLFDADADFSYILKRHLFRPDYTFENFAVSGGNQLAFAAATHVAKNPGDSYNPLFLYGGVGVGKTHLMQAVGVWALKKNPHMRLVYCAGEEFTNEIIEAIRTKTTPAFRNKFRKATLLLIDDIQFIAGKETVQEEFFHTFNAVLKGGGQIVLTSDKAPSEIAKLEPRIKSRLEGGLLVDIAPPDFELRVAIFLIKARNRGVDFPISLAKLIAASITDTRGLEGILTRIMSEAGVKNTPFSEEFVLGLLGKGKNEHAKDLLLQGGNSPTSDMFLESLCSYFQVKPTLLKGKKRERAIVLPRHILMYLLRMELGLSLSDIGNFVGGRDHTTVLHAVEKVSLLIVSNEKVRGDVLGIKKHIYG